MSTPDLPWIVLISIARSGTTHLIRMMKGIKNIHVVHEEWLNYAQVTWAQPEQLHIFSAEIGREITSHLDPRLTEWVRANKRRSLELLQANARPSDRAAIMKLFQRYVSGEEFHDLFLADPRTRFLLLKRRPIDSYISLQKAKALDKWVNKDTTGLRVTLDPRDYLDWHRDRSEWFGWVETALRDAGRPYGLLDYDADIAQGDAHMLNRTVEELAKAGFKTRRRFGHLTELALRRAGPSWLGGQHDPRFGAQKQDHAASPEGKVKNWAEFLDGIGAQPGGPALLDGFMPPAS